jgi:hypothetical protein
MTGHRTAVRSRPRSHSIQNGVVAAAILAELVLIIGHSLFGWGATTYAATPRPLAYDAPAPPSGAQVLMMLSAAAARQPAQPAGTATAYAYVRKREWRLAPEKAGHPPPSRVIPTVTESWLRADGSGRVVSGGASVEVPAAHPLPALSPNRAVLARLLGMASPASVPSARQFVALTSLSGTEPIPSLVEAGILRLLALIPGVSYSGGVTDRDGRPGIGVSVESSETGLDVLYTLIFNQSTGQLLEADQTLDGAPGDLDVPQGSVIAYTTFLASGYTARPLG